MLGVSLRKGTRQGLDCSSLFPPICYDTASQLTLQISMTTNLIEAYISSKNSDRRNEYPSVWSKVGFFPIHRSYFCVRRTDGAARIYFSSLYLSRNVSPYGRG